MTYSPPGKKQENEYEHPVNDGDGKCCLEIWVYIYREFLKEGMNKNFFQLV